MISNLYHYMDRALVLVFSLLCPNNQLFIADTIMYKNSIFLFSLPVEILENTRPDDPIGPNLKLCFIQILLYKDFGGRQDAVQKPPSNFTSN